MATATATVTTQKKKLPVFLWSGSSKEGGERNGEMEAVDAAGGTWIKSTGDGALATFTSPDAALECGVQLARMSTGHALNLRTRVHAGQCEQRGQGDVGGIAVHVAARIAARADAGSVLTSETVRSLVMGSDWTFEARGEHELAGVPGSWQLYALATDNERYVPSARVGPSSG